MSEIQPIDQVRSTLAKMTPELSNALPPHLSPEKFNRVVMTSLQMNPDLLGGDRRTLLGACLKAAQDGLLPDGREAAFVMFKGNVQYMPMVGGILKKIRNSGELASIRAHVVYDKDQFDYTLGDDEHITHKPSLDSDRGKPLAAYAIAETKDGAVYREVMSVGDIEKIRAASRSGNSQYSPWANWWDEMARKTVIRRLAKRLPSSADVDQVIQHDDEAMGVVQREPIDITPKPESLEEAQPPSKLKAKIVEAE